MRPTSLATSDLLSNGALISVLMFQWYWGLPSSPFCFSAWGRPPRYLSDHLPDVSPELGGLQEENISHQYPYIRNQGISNYNLRNFGRHLGDPTLLILTCPALPCYWGIIWVVSEHILTQREGCRILWLEFVACSNLKVFIIYRNTWCRFPESGSCSNKWSTLNLFSALPVYSISSTIELYFFICLRGPTDA